MFLKARASGSVSDGIIPCIMKAKKAYANLSHLWHLYDISLATKGWFYSASPREVLLSNSHPMK